MHLKNFSLMHTDKGVLFLPAYDLLNVNLIFPGDKEELALSLGISEVVRIIFTKTSLNNLMQCQNGLKAAFYLKNILKL